MEPTSTKPRVFAIVPHGSSWIEFRRGPIKVIRSQLTRSLVAPKKSFLPTKDAPHGTWVRKGEKYTMVFKQTTITSGKPLGRLPYHEGYRWFHRYFPVNEVVELDSDGQKRVNSPKWRKAHLKDER